MECKCLQCGNAFEVSYPSFARKFCTKTCALNYRWAHTKRNNIKFVCEICGKEFEIKKSDHRIKEGKPIKYCSKKCMGIGQRVGKIVKCPACGKEFYSTRTTYCSPACLIKSHRNDEKYNELIESGHWKPTHIYAEKYLISDKGELFSVTTGKVLKPSINRQGYCFYGVGVSRKDKKRISAHRLVATAFISNPDNKPQIDHINGIRNDNRVDNLRWVTAKENVNNPITKPKHKEAVRKNITKANKPRLVPVEVYKGGELIRVFSTSREAAKFVGTTPQNVSSCLLGRRKTAKGYTFKNARIHHQA